MENILPIMNRGLSFLWCCTYARYINTGVFPSDININKVFSVIRSCYKYDTRKKGARFYEL